MEKKDFTRRMPYPIEPQPQPYHPYPGDVWNLVITIGLPYSGKSTWAFSYLNAPVVAPDSIRKAVHGMRFVPDAEDLVWAMAKIFVHSLFMAGHNTVVVDATHTTAKRRDFWKDPRWKRSFIIMDISPEICLKRASEAGDEEILPIIERMANQLEFEGVYYGLQDTQDAMANHIKNPDGSKGQPQFYHEGTAGD